jgi:hypothetical protein
MRSIGLVISKLHLKQPSKIELKMSDSTCPIHPELFTILAKK